MGWEGKVFLWPNSLKVEIGSRVMFYQFVFQTKIKFCFYLF